MGPEGFEAGEGGFLGLGAACAIGTCGGSAAFGGGAGAGAARCSASTPEPIDERNARPEDAAARDAKLSAGDPQPDDHGHEAGTDAGKEGAVARLGAVGAGGAEAAPQSDRILSKPTEQESLINSPPASMNCTC